ncbi:MAG: ComEA family DNA-binding protein [Methylococcales bacterium]|nr:ComEA family DNA-binding protein [Methylococcales bacterium]
MKKIFLLLALFSANVFATPVNVNTADAQTIASSLNGIGEKKAQAIIEYREKNGDFKTIDSLTEVAGIGAKTVEKNKEDILLTDKVEKEVKTQVKKPEAKEKK